MTTFNELFISACKYGYLEMAQELLEQEGLMLFDVRIQAFRIACENEHLKVAQWLMSLGISLDEVKSKDNQIFRDACACGFLEIVQYLWSLGLNLEDVRSRDNHAFRYACACGHLEVVKYLWSLGLELSDVRSENNDALHDACKNGFLEVVKWLWSLGLNLEDVRSDNNCTFSCVCRKGRLEVAKYLWSLGLNLTDVGNQDELRNPEIIQWLQSLGLNNVRNHYETFSYVRLIENKTELLTEVNRRRNDDKCVICYVNTINCAFIPCGHLCVCLSCSRRLRDCPLCRGRIENVLRIFRK